MEPDHLHFGGGAAGTVLHPLVLVGMLLAIALLMALPRRQLVVPFLLITILVPLGQQIYLGGAHWLVLRIVILAGCLRLLVEKVKAAGPLFPFGLNGIDKAFKVWAICVSLSPMLLYHTSAVIPLQLASCLQSFGGYFFLRYSIQDQRDVVKATKTLACIAFFLSLCMMIERFQGTNVFGYLGGGPIIPTLRNGLVRAQACFSHPILAGCFGATLMPLFFSLWKGRKVNAPLAAVGMLGSFMMVFFSSSSTPLMALAGGIGALFLWPIRRSMRIVRWAIVFAVVGLQIVMKAPVWFVVSHVNLTGTSDAWDRAMLIDTFIRHFGDWWLIGADPSGWGWSMWDLSNQFVGVGETGGLLAFVAFIAIISIGFSRLGRVQRQVRDDRRQEWLYWSLGAVMFAHILAYFGVSYFDQTSIWWFAFLAMISATTCGLNVHGSGRSVKSSLSTTESTKHETSLTPHTVGVSN